MMVRAQYCTQLAKPDIKNKHCFSEMGNNSHFGGMSAAFPFLKNGYKDFKLLRRAQYLVFTSG